jgi:hypothetical protein
MTDGRLFHVEHRIRQITFKKKDAAPEPTSSLDGQPLGLITLVKHAPNWNMNRNPGRNPGRIGTIIPPSKPLAAGILALSAHRPLLEQPNAQRPGRSNSKDQEGSRRIKKDQEGSRRIKKNQGCVGWHDHTPVDVPRGTSNRKHRTGSMNRKHENWTVEHCPTTNAQLHGQTSSRPEPKNTPKPGPGSKQLCANIRGALDDQIKPGSMFHVEHRV